jgi:hypothetical protein
MMVDLQVPRPPALIRTWVFSGAGAALAWFVFGSAAVGAWALLVRPQNDVTRGSLVLLGCWWLVALVAVHWVVPVVDDHDRPLEALAAAAWHAMLAVCLTGAWVWQSLFDGTTYVNRGLAGAGTALLAWLVCSAVTGLLVLWLRGRPPLAVLRYGALATLAGVVWMAVGLLVSLPA